MLDDKQLESDTAQILAFFKERDDKSSALNQIKDLSDLARGSRLIVLNSPDSPRFQFVDLKAGVLKYGVYEIRDGYSRIGAYNSSPESILWYKERKIISNDSILWVSHEQIQRGCVYDVKGNRSEAYPLLHSIIKPSIKKPKVI